MPETRADRVPTGATAAGGGTSRRNIYVAYNWTLAAGYAAGALVMVWGAGPPGYGIAAVFAAFALLAALARRLSTPLMRVAVFASVLAVPVLVAWIALRMGWGLAAPGLTLSGLLVFAVCASTGWRTGLAVALVCLASLAVVAVWGPVAALPPPPVLLGTQLIAIGGGLVGGWLVSVLFNRYLARTHERQQRFSHLLALSADVYWETDAAGRVRMTARPDATVNGGLAPWAPIGGLDRPMWELDQFSCEPDVLDRLQADMQARQRFRNVPIGWAMPDGTRGSYLVSGEPRFGAHGIFDGYWGLARDITAVQATHEALAAVETRYQNLFAHNPTPLVLHREGRVIDANEAAVRLFGHSTLDTLLGVRLIDCWDAGESRRQAEERMAQLQTLPPGTALPVTGFRLVIGGRPVPVRATAVIVRADGGPAVLSILIDDTERAAAEQAVRSSEALLSHLVATSPDLITLTDMASGRYAMVNAAFERVSGWTAAEVVGRTSLEIGIWASPADRERFVGALRDKGSVEHLPVTFRTRPGTPVSMLVSAARFAMDQHDYMVINARDVSETERQRMEREAILDNASVGIALTRNRRFVLVNRAFEQLYRWPAGSALGRPVAAVWRDEAEYREVGALLRPDLHAGKAVELERETERGDGSRFVVRIRGRAVDPTHPAEGGTVWIAEDVTERREFERKLAAARDAAEAASRAKSEFLANTSHELRTPLNGMLGLASLARGDMSDERRRQYLDQIVQSGQALAAIISDILDLSKIEAGKLALEDGTFDLGAELRSLHATAHALAQGRGLVLRFELDGSEPGSIEGLVRGDALRLRQIVLNFIGNAVKFTPRGFVRVAARRVGPVSAHGAMPAHPPRVRIEVQDSGPGIAEDVRARLFTPFTQADQSTTRRYGGTGLGLSISRELATLMGGEVGVESAPGRGSVFWAELPLPRVGPAPAVGTAAPLGSSEVALDLHIELSPALVGKRVLMVEDNPVNMLIAVALLERWGLAVGQAADGPAALAALQAAARAGHPYDAVLMDVQMPTMSGHETTRALRAAGHRMPVVALTAAALVTERDEALAAGMNDFLTKPIDAARLHAALLRWLGAPAAGAQIADNGTGLPVK